MDDETIYKLMERTVPNEGLLYLDTCGLETLSRNLRVSSRLEQNLKVMGVRLPFLRRRGNFTTSPLIFSELDHSKRWFREEVKIIDSKIDRHKEFRRKANSLPSIYADTNSKIKVSRSYVSETIGVWEDKVRKGLRIYSGITNLLIENEHLHKDQLGITPKEIDDYISSSPNNLSLADKQLISYAVQNGVDCGVLTTDTELIETLKKSCVHFGLKNFFIADARSNRYYYPRGDRLPFK